MTDDLYAACTTFVRWLENRVVTSARGGSFPVLEHDPSGRFWLGRLAPEEAVIERGMGERGERLDPCAIGVRAKIQRGVTQRILVRVRASYWDRPRGAQQWRKRQLPDMQIPVEVSGEPGRSTFGAQASEAAYANDIGSNAFRVAIDVEIRDSADASSVNVVLLVVNRSDKESNRIRDTNLYETSYQVQGLKVQPFVLDSLPDSFRYDRRVGVYGINCGVSVDPAGNISSVDAIAIDRGRPSYWTFGDKPDLRFSVLADDPLPSCVHVLEAHSAWGQSQWSDPALNRLAEQENWSAAMREEASRAKSEFGEERSRLESGIALLRSDSMILRAFKLMNRCMAISAEKNGRDAWRPFQLGFLLANLRVLLGGNDDRDIADIVWFATGGGKTETYLGLIATASFYDRLRGKTTGITAWSRFPLRLLSLQQTQRFADAMASAELVRRDEQIPGDPFSVGFFVGKDATPNVLKVEPAEFEPDIEDETMPARYRVLLRCPFCSSEKIEMSFDRRLWRLEHRCCNDACPWPEVSLPFYIVDDEIYRFLPTVLVGTLDKAAAIAMQASMRGLVGQPQGMCSTAGHGYTYAPRSGRPNGCLVPDCRAARAALPMRADLFGLTFRLQDELHLLKDSLGAVDSHYEALYDGLQEEICGLKAKILASSATLTGYEKQVDALYRRQARVFPLPAPRASSGFWTAESDSLMRRFVALAPRGVTLEYMTDNVVTTLQKSIRWLLEQPSLAAKEIGVPVEVLPELVSLYGTNVVYGNTLRDLDAVDRSLETQIQVEDGHLNTDSLTGRREFEGVRQILHRLENPEPEFTDRLHVITASSMMSHGVDINRLNVMCVLGMPLTTAEFIQSTSRVGRTWPGLVFVAFKMARERDASVFRLFPKYVEQGDRFVEPVPVTRRSRRVLERTVAGLELARILMIHEVSAQQSLVSIEKLRRYMTDRRITAQTEVQALSRYLGLTGALDDALKRDLEAWLSNFFRNLETPPHDARFARDLGGSEPMISLRDVEEQTWIFGSLTP